MNRLRTAEYTLKIRLTKEGNLVTRRGGSKGDYAIHSLDVNGNTTLYKVVMTDSENRIITSTLINKLKELEEKYEVKCFIATKIPNGRFIYTPLDTYKRMSEVGQTG